MESRHQKRMNFMGHLRLYPETSAKSSQRRKVKISRNQREDKRDMAEECTNTI